MGRAKIRDKPLFSQVRIRNMEQTISPSALAAGRAASVCRSLSVAYVSPSWPPAEDANGIVMYTDAMTEALRGRGHSTTILAHHLTGASDFEGVYDLKRFHARRSRAVRILDRLRFGKSLSPIRDRVVVESIQQAGRRAIAERGIQLLEMEESFGWPLKVSRALPIPVVIRLHGPWFLNGTIANASLDKAFHARLRKEGEALRRAEWISAPSRAVLERTRDYYNLPLERAEVIPNPAPRIPAEIHWNLENCDPQSILFVGRFDRLKGGDLMIDAFARVAGRFPAARLRFVGPDQGFLDDDRRSWNITEYIHSRILDPAVRNRIECLGRLPNQSVMELRGQALVSVVSSRQDNFPTTVTEAMAMGCPIVAARVGGIPEQIDDGVNGLLCAANDADDLAEKIGRLLSDTTLAAQLGDRARLDCKAKLSPEVISDRMADFYTRVVRSAPRN
jgi:glycosyltransferase involved in cell wall biosynthesis